jgi:hypothetical protein
VKESGYSDWLNIWPKFWIVMIRIELPVTATMASLMSSLLKDDAYSSGSYDKGVWK